ncbi:MAG: enoyl-CoA hydratase/isomerase family protein [Acidimicrobiaceae bacterium]
MSQFETLDVSVSGEIGALELNRPAQLNALSRQTLQDLAAAARWFDSQQQVKIVVVSGQGRSLGARVDRKKFYKPHTH